MKKIKEEIKGGEKATGPFYIFSPFPEAGETYAKTKHTTYACTLEMPYQVTIEEQIKPPLDKRGKPKKEQKPEPRYHVDVRFPFEIDGMKGEVELFVHAKTIEEIPSKILQAIGEKLAVLKVNPRD